MGQARQVILKHTEVAAEIVEMTINAPVVAMAAKAGQFVRVLASDDGELIPLTLADWDAEAGTIDLVIQGLGTSSKLMNRMAEGDAFSGIAGPLGRPSDVHRYAEDETVVFAAGGVGLPAIYPIAKAHLAAGNNVTMIIGFRSAEHLFWTGDDERMGNLKARYGDKVDLIYCTNDGTFGVPGFVTGPLEEMLKDGKMSKGRKLAEVISVGPPMMMRAVSDLTKPYAVPTVVSLNSIMVDATGMCGACMVPVIEDGRNVRKHACIDGPEFDAHTVEWDKFLPRFGQFRTQEVRSLEAHGLA
jgi:glutamate synthase (NADPH/NADH) small chain